MPERAIGVVNCIMNLSSNNADLIYRSEYFTETVPQSLLNNYHRIESVSDKVNADARLYIIDNPDLPPLVSVAEDDALAQGDFTRLENESKDRRYAVLGTQGLLYRYILATLERHHGITSFHSCSLYDGQKNIITIIMGSNGSGKTTLLLAGITKGYKVFSTGLTHFRVSGDHTVFYKGGLLVNISLGSLLYEFPSINEQLCLQFHQISDPWQVKVSVDLGRYQAATDQLINPEIRILVPRRESRHSEVTIRHMRERCDLSRLLFENASEKIAGSFVLYGVLPVCGLDTPSLARRRFAAVQRLIDIAELEQASVVVASPQTCAGVL
jgi:energy-coupling factor transporter ATP-binding protein EcfA2